MPVKYDSKVWYGGDFSGHFYRSHWKKGNYLDGEFEFSRFEGGTFKKGKIKNSNFFGGTIEECEAYTSNFSKTKLLGGTYIDCCFVDMEINNCTLEGGRVAKGGKWVGGTFLGGIFNGSEWISGYWKNGRWGDGCVWREGYIYDSDIESEYESLNGVIRDGLFVFSKENPEYYFLKKIDRKNKALKKANSDKTQQEVLGKMKNEGVSHIGVYDLGKILTGEVVFNEEG